MIVRPDGTPLYNFASVVDDVDMQITHVVRAEEHLSNTYAQVLVFEALGRALPAFAHVPYVAEPGSRKKLSKRKGEEYKAGALKVYLHEYADEGYLPEAMLNYLARLGWSYDDTPGDLRPRRADREVLARPRQQLARQPRPGQAVLDRGRVDEGPADGRRK